MGMVDIQTFDHIAGTVVKIFTIISLFFAFLVFLYKKAWPWLKKKQDEQSNLAKNVATIRQTIDTELKTNGGNSLKDVILRLEKQISRVEYRQEFLEQTQRAQLNASNIVFWKADKDGRITEASHYLQLFLDRTESELIGDNWVNCVHPEDRDTVFTNWKKAVDLEMDFISEYRFIKRDHTELPVRAIFYRLKNVVDNKLMGFFGVLVPLS